MHLIFRNRQEGGPIPKGPPRGLTAQRALFAAAVDDQITRITGPGEEPLYGADQVSCARNALTDPGPFLLALSSWRDRSCR
jgi:hypothetical protein